jgi:hypothetical protein
MGGKNTRKEEGRGKEGMGLEHGAGEHQGCVNEPSFWDFLVPDDFS